MKKRTRPKRKKIRKKPQKTKKDRIHHSPAQDFVSTVHGADPIVAPEHKAMATKGITLAGKITLHQFERLVEAGYEGETVMRWTKYRAAQEIEKVERGGGSKKAKTARGLREIQKLIDAERRAYLESLATCPYCQSPVRPDRLAKHIQRVHGDVEPNN